MKLLTIYSDDILHLRDNFINTYKDDIPLIVEKIEHDMKYPTKSKYQQALIKKCEIIAKHIGENLGNILIFADIDIEFFNTMRESIETEFIKTDLNMAFMRERVNRPFMNTGFVLMKCDREIYKLYYNAFTTLQCSDAYRLGDQTFITNHISEYDIKWQLLSDKFRTSCLTSELKNDLILFHANGCEDKIKSMAEIREQFKNLNNVPIV